MESIQIISCVTKVTVILDGADENSSVSWYCPAEADCAEVGSIGYVYPIASEDFQDVVFGTVDGKEFVSFLINAEGKKHCCMLFQRAGDDDPCTGSARRFRVLKIQQIVYER